jgi:hypothetical protein
VLLALGACGEEHDGTELAEGPRREPEAITMEVPEAEAAFRAFLDDRGTPLEQLDPDDAIDAVLDFYAEQGASDIDDTYGDGDTLLFQWGTYDWGEGPFFQFDLTRQLVSTQTGTDDDAIWQLSLTLHYAPDEENSALGSGDQWADRATAGSLRAYLDVHVVTAYARSHAPERVELLFSQV